MTKQQKERQRIQFHVEEEDIIAHERRMMAEGWTPLDARECHFPTNTCVTYYWMEKFEGDE